MSSDPAKTRFIRWRPDEESTSEETKDDVPEIESSPEKSEPEAENEVLRSLQEIRESSREEPPPEPPDEPEVESPAKPAPSSTPEPRAQVISGGPSQAPEEEPFEQPGVAKLGIVGGKGVGKSYLFQAMMYRTYSGIHSGALTYFLEKDGIRLFSALEQSDRAKRENIPELLESYRHWERLLTTQEANQRWYRLRLYYRCGLLGRRREAMDVEFFDGSGEGFFEARQTGRNWRIWQQGYLDARVMVFCLPLWTVFPAPGLTEDDRREREDQLRGFEEVVQNYRSLRELESRTHPVASILALTMADDPRCALDSLQDAWIYPYMDAPHEYLKALRKGSGVARYLANARRVSEGLYEELLHVGDPMVSGLPQRLDFGGGPPWLVPVSAVLGTVLDAVERGDLRPFEAQAPVPVHVELPLLVALGEHTNALM